MCQAWDDHDPDTMDLDHLRANAEPHDVSPNGRATECSAPLLNRRIVDQNAGRSERQLADKLKVAR